MAAPVFELNHFGSGAQTAGTLKFQWVADGHYRLLGARGYLDTAPTMAAGSGDAFIVDLNRNGTSVWAAAANRMIWAHNTKTSSTTKPDTGVIVAPGDRLTLDIDQIGDTVAGSNLSVSIRLQKL